MGIIVPTRDTELEDRRHFKRLVRETLVSRALGIGITRYPEALIIRDLLPIDLGLVDWTVPTDQLCHLVKLVNHEISANTLIGIYSVLQLGVKPTATTIKFRLGYYGSTTLGLHGLDVIYAEMPIIAQLKDIIKGREDLQVLLENKELVSALQGNPMEGYFSEPYIYMPNHIVNIDVSVRENSDNYLVLGGFVCELAGMSVT